MSSALREAASGAVGGMVALCITYPLTIAKVRLQAQQKLADKIDDHGDLGADEGLGGSDAEGPIDAADTKDTGDTAIDRMSMSVTGEIAAATTEGSPPRPAADTAAAATPPPRKHYASAIDCLQSTVKEQGIAGLYPGVRTACLQKGIEKFTFFYTVSLVSKLSFFRRHRGQPASKLLSLLQGMVAAFLTQLMTMPVEMVVIRSQSALAGEPTSFRKTLASIIKEGGVGQLWSGLVPNSVLTINPGINSMIQSVLSRDPSQMAGIPHSRLAFENFATGFVSKLCASCITYPLVVIKVRMLVAGRAAKQAAPPTDQGRSKSTAPAAVKATPLRPKKQRETALSMPEQIALLYSENGVAGFYKGLKTQLLNAVLNEAIVNMVRKELTPDAAN